MRVLLALVCSSSLLAAQPETFAPPSAGTGESNSAIALLDSPAPTRAQICYGVGEVAAPTAISLWNEIAFRVDVRGAATSISPLLEIRLSSQGVPRPDDMDPYDATANIGTDSTSVFGPARVALPAVAPGQPATWITFPFRMPFQFVAGERLLVEVLVADGSPLSGYLLDADATAPADWNVQTTPLGADCRGGVRSTGIATSPLGWLAINLGYEVAPLPANSAVFLALGATATSFGGVTLPLSLDAFGAAGCQLLVAPEAVTSLGSYTTPRGTELYWAPTLWRRSPALLGARLYSQFLVLDPGANPLGLTTSAGATHTIVSGPASMRGRTIQYGPAGIGQICEHPDTLPAIRLR